MASVMDVNVSNWESEVLQSEVPVLVDFWAEWCRPCRALAPTVEAVAAEMQGKVKVVKLNTDDARPVAEKYGVMSIPVLMLFKEGKIVDQMLGGNLQKGAIVDRLEKHL